MKETVLWNLKMDTSKFLITTGLKLVFSHQDKSESKKFVLRKQNKLLRGYLNEIVGPIDPNHLNISLGVALERKEVEKALREIDLFLDTCRRMCHNFEDR